MNARLWVKATCGCAAAALLLIVGMTVWIDPYFHYHAPLTEKFWYALDNERSQNHGIVRHFDYAAMIIGSSMMENTKASEVEELFGLKTIKTCFSGMSFKELRNTVLAAIRSHPQLQLIIIGLDQDRFLSDKDWMRDDLGVFPDYLYDHNPANDVNYVFNKDVLFRIVRLLHSSDWPGITSFDDYARWAGWGEKYGRKSVLGKRVLEKDWGGETGSLTDYEVKTVMDNINQNIRPILLSGKSIVFILTPGSILQRYRYLGRKTIEAEMLFVQEILKFPHARIFSFNTCKSLVADLNHYKDSGHYGPWVNSQMLRWIREGKGELTQETLVQYLERELALYSNFDFTELNGQHDEDDDGAAAVRLQKETK